LNSPGAINVYLLTENRLLRDTLARLLRKKNELRVVGVSRLAENTKEDIINSKCHVVLTDCFSTGANLGFLHDALDHPPGIKLLLFGMADEVDLFLKAVYFGISGYLLKEASAAEIVAALYAAAQGQATCPPNLCLTLFQHLKKNGTSSSHSLDWNVSNRKGITARQLQLIRLVANGLTNKEIAANLNLSEFTVKNHVRRIMKQVKAENRHEAVTIIRASGDLLPLPDRN
jgi:DNA-binding NarL/FixJ family response regulator